MTDTTYVDTFEWVKKIAVAYIESYEQFLRAAAYYPAYYPMISAIRARDRARASARAAKRRARLSIENLNRYTATRTMRDGRSVSVRAVRAEDKARLLEHFTQLSSVSLYYRFLGTRSSLTDEELDRFTRLDTAHAALVVTTGGGKESIIGFIQYVRIQDTSRAQIACSVSDTHQGRGIGSLLLDLLSQIALTNGITEFEGDALPDNQRVLAIAAKNGRQIVQSTESGVAHMRISLRPQRRTPSRRRNPASAGSRRPGLSWQRRSGTRGWLM